jgi:hypothetical protein
MFRSHVLVSTSNCLAHRGSITLAQANADLARLLPVWMDSWSNGPNTNGHGYENWRIRPSIGPLKQQVVGNVGDVLWW